MLEHHRPKTSRDGTLTRFGMSDMRQPQRDALERQVLEILELEPRGMSEYELIGHLREAGHPAFQRPLSQDNLHLFRTHFLLFHVLYILRGRLWREQRADLQISALRIALRPCRAGAQGHRDLRGRDPLCDYYLDLSHLDDTTAEQVEALLQGFWSGAGPSARRTQALSVMGLSDPVDDGSIRRQYRRLVMRHHPDRGGDKAQLQALNAAMDILMPARS